MQKIESSFRDPDAFVFVDQDKILRQINVSYKADYNQLMDSGLYKKLVGKQWLIPHEEVERPLQGEGWKVIAPEPIKFISFPYEWSFSQLKEAALLTLKIHRQALEYGMRLKDASNFNVQTHSGKMVFIDTCSFERYVEDEPWIAYKQFCEHFLAPLALMQYVDISANNMLKLHLDGIPLSFAAKILPFKARTNMGILTHVIMHSSTVNKHQHEHENKKKGSLSLKAQKCLIDNLYNIIKKMQPHGGYTQWQDYNQHTSYNETGAKAKKQLLSSWFEEMKPSSMVDLGCNDGYYSSLALPYSDMIITSDMDPNALDSLWRHGAEEKNQIFVPILSNILNPTPSIGWNNQERTSFYTRLAKARPDCIMALALIHHLAITGQVTLDMIADMINGLESRYVIIEWVPADDHQSQKLINARDEQFASYTRDNFVKAMSAFFSIKYEEPIAESKRTLFLFER